MTKNKCTAIPYGSYVLDGGTRVDVIDQNSTTSLKFGPGRLAAIMKAVQTPKGCDIAYSLRGKLTRGLLTKESEP